MITIAYIVHAQSNFTTHPYLIPVDFHTSPFADSSGSCLSTCGVKRVRLVEDGVARAALATARLSQHHDAQFTGVLSFV